jgi:four helix bundle protein
MATFKRFEDIDAWQKARILANHINEITLSPTFKENQELKWQIKKSAGSIMDNIAEGFERGGKKEFIQFLSISKGSAGEIRSQIYRSIDSGLISNQQGEELLKIAGEISMMLEGLMNYLRNSELKGTKYKL